MSHTNPPPAQLTDSPWFWVCVFSAMALAGTIAIGPKYEARQRNIELKFEARLRSQEFSERVEADNGDTSRARDELQPAEYENYDAHRELMIRLTPLLLLLSVVFLASLGRVCYVQAKAENAPLLDGRRIALLLLAMAYCGATFFVIWFAYSGPASTTANAPPSDGAWMAAWVLGRGMKSLLIFLLSSILIALAVSQLWKRKP